MHTAGSQEQPLQQAGAAGCKRSTKGHTHSRGKEEEHGALSELKKRVGNLEFKSIE